MPRGCRRKGPANWNTLFNYELECQRVKCSRSQSSNTCFVLFISVTLGRAEDDDLGKFKLFSSVREVHSRMHQVIVPGNIAQQACFPPPDLCVLATPLVSSWWCIHTHCAYIYVFNPDPQGWWDETVLSKTIWERLLHFALYCIDKRKYRVKHAAKKKNKNKKQLLSWFSCTSLLNFILQHLHTIFSLYTSLPSVRCTGIMLLFTFLRSIIFMMIYLSPMIYFYQFTCHYFYSMLFFFRRRTPRWWVKPVNGTVTLLTLGLYFYTVYQSIH